MQHVSTGNCVSSSSQCDRANVGEGRIVRLRRAEQIRPSLEGTYTRNSSSAPSRLFSHLCTFSIEYMMLYFPYLHAPHRLNHPSIPSNPLPLKPNLTQKRKGFPPSEIKKIKKSSKGKTKASLSKPPQIRNVYVKKS